jgi:isopentenyl-diphosphate Delta-isomerase
MKKKILFYVPRILAALYAIFLSLFSLDVFSEDGEWYNLLIGFIIHMFPALAVLMCLLIAHKRQVVGSFLFASLAVFYMIIANNEMHWILFLVIPFPLLVIAGIFLWEVLSKEKIELIEVLDDKGEMTGEIKSLITVHHEGLWHQSVHVWIINELGEVLLQKRSLTDYVHPGKWDISVAGHVPAGESYEKTAVREIKEEVGIDIDKQKLKLMFEYKKESKQPERHYHNRELDYVYFVKVNKKEFDQNAELQESEVAAVRWFTFNELEQSLYDLEQSRQFVPHGEYYSKVINALKQKI